MTNLSRLLQKDDKLKIFFAALVFIVLRSPIVLFQGRIIAEEGTVYFQDAWNLPFWSALLAPHQGYYSLLDNLVAAIAAYVFPLSLVSVVFSFAAMLILLWYVAIVLQCELFSTPRARLFAVAICLLAPSLEVWMNLEDGQFLLAAGVILFLFSDPERLPWFRNITILFAGLTGPVASSFLPFFYIRALRRKTWGAWLQAVSLTVPTLLQAWFVIYAVRHGERSIAGWNKFHWLGPIFLLKTVSLTFGTRLSFFLFLSLLLHHSSTLLFLLCWALAIAGFAFLLYLAGKGGTLARKFMGLALWAFTFAYIGIGEPALVVLGGANRYFFIPDLLLWLMILVTYLSHQKASQHPPRLYRFLVFFLLASGLLDAAGYWKRSQRIDHLWRPQIALWEKDPSTTIAVNPIDWPYRVVLKPKHPK